MIYLYTGTPGSGKSLHVARVIRLWLRLKSRVISTCNVDTRLCLMSKLVQFIYEISRGKLFIYDNEDEKGKLFNYIDIHQITPTMLYEHAAKYHKAGKERQTLVIFDECVSIFSPTVLTTDKWNEWERFFQYHRHLGFEVILIPQSVKLISRKVVEYCEYEVRHRAMKNSGFFGLIVSTLCGGLFSAVTYWRGIKKHIHKEWFLFHYYLGKMYNSYAMFEVILKDYRRGQLTAPVKSKKLSRKEKAKQEQIIKLIDLLNVRKQNLINEKVGDFIDKKNNSISDSAVADC